MIAVLALIKRVGSFALIPALSLVTPLLVVPVVSRTHGGEGVLAISLGQSIGGVASIVVALSWPLVGSAEVAGARSEETRQRIYHSSLQMRLLALLIVAPCAISLATITITREQLSAALSAVALSTYGLSAAWYFAGIGSARNLIVLEVVPRVFFSAASAAALVIGAPLWLYPALLLTSSALSLRLVTRSILDSPFRFSFSIAIRELRRQLRASAARGVNGIYNGGLTFIVATVSPSFALLFTSVDRLQKSAYNSCALVPEALMSWVLTGVGAVEKDRRQAVLLFDLFFALASALLFYALFPYMISFLYSDTVSPDASIRIASSATVLSLILARCWLLHVLLTRNMVRYAANLVAGASILGIFTVGVGAHVFGAVGALVAVAGIELTVVMGSVLGPVLGFKGELVK